MQIFTIELLLEAFVQSGEIVGLLIGSLLSTAWTEVMNFFPSFIEEITAGDWAGVVIRVLILVSCTMIVYRIVRKMPFMTLRSMSDMN